MEWWVFPALVLCAVMFTAAAGVLVFLAARGVWRLLARYEPAHAARETREGRSWVPWDTDPRFGSMQLDADRALTAYELGIPVEPDMAWREMVALGEEIGDALPWPDQVVYPGTAGIIHQLPAPPLHWREVAHEGDWRDQTRRDLAPAVLDQEEVMPVGALADSSKLDQPRLVSSGPGVSPLASPGPVCACCGVEPQRPYEITCEECAGWEERALDHERLGHREPEPERTWAGRVVETSDEWLRRLVANAAPGWTYAGTVAA